MGFLEGNTGVWWRLITSVPALANPPDYWKLRAVYRPGAPNYKAYSQGVGYAQSSSGVREVII